MDLEVKLLPWQKGLMQSEDKIAGLYCGRGTGKTIVLSWMIALNLVQQKRIMVYAQTYKALSTNLFEEIFNRLNDMKIKYKYDRSQMIITVGNKGKCFGFTYERPDACRGTTEIEFLYLDEIALAPTNLLAITAPCCRGNFTPYIRFASSPRIGSYWDYWVKEGMANRSIDVFTASMLDNTFLSEESIQLQMQAITDPALLQQEIYGKILDDNDGSQLVNLKLFSMNACIDNFRWSFGIDCSGEGKDKATITLRKGHILKELLKFPKLTGDEAYTQVNRLCIKYGINEDNLNIIGIDMAYGQAVYERLSTKWNCKLVPFASKSEQDIYANMRAEMYFRLQRYMQEGMEGITDEDLRQELLATRWTLDKHDKIILIPKDEIKAILRRSPDSADSLALSFCEEDTVDEYIPPKHKEEEYEDYQYRILGDPDD